MNSKLLGISIASISALFLCLIIIIYFSFFDGKHQSFWYPVKLLDVKCSQFSGPVYKMKHSHYYGARYLNQETGYEMILPDQCVISIVREFKRNRGNINKLTKEQREIIKYDE